MRTFVRRLSMERDTSQAQEALNFELNHRKEMKRGHDAGPTFWHDLSQMAQLSCWWLGPVECQD